MITFEASGFLRASSLPKKPTHGEPAQKSDRKIGFTKHHNFKASGATLTFNALANIKRACLECDTVSRFK